MLIRDGAAWMMSTQRNAEKIKRDTKRKLKAEFSKEYEKHSDELDDMLSGITNLESLTEESIRIMFDALRGRGSAAAIKEAEDAAAAKALEDAGFVAVGSGASGGGGTGGNRSSLNKDQQAEMLRMGLESEEDYLEILRGRQEKDKLAGKPPRKLISSTS
jgi:hypothetical protein